MNTETERLENDLRQVVNDAENLISQVAASAGNGMEEIRGKVESRIQSAKATLDEAKDAVSGRAKQAAYATEEYVGEHIWQSLAVAAALGVVVGMLIRRH